MKQTGAQSKDPEGVRSAMLYQGVFTTLCAQHGTKDTASRELCSSMDVSASSGSFDSAVVPRCGTPAPLKMTAAGGVAFVFCFYYMLCLPVDVGHADVASAIFDIN
jgi:hypothetical protein